MTKGFQGQAEELMPPKNNAMETHCRLEAQGRDSKTWDLERSLRVN